MLSMALATSTLFKPINYGSTLPPGVHWEVFSDAQNSAFKIVLFRDDRLLGSFRISRLEVFSMGQAEMGRRVREGCEAILFPQAPPITVELGNVDGDREIDELGEAGA
jgi:hypothetical protein